MQHRKGIKYDEKIGSNCSAVGLALFSLTGCAQSGVKTSAEATPENPMVLTLAHGLSETHTVHIAMTEFAEKVKERTDGGYRSRSSQMAS